MTTLHFQKMHGLGNDFIVIDATTTPHQFTPKMLRQLSNRHTGIGFDQCLIVEPPRSTKEDFFYRIYNADGGEVAQCGNGARCLAKFIEHNGLSEKNEYLVATHSSLMKLTPMKDNMAAIELPEPKWAPNTIPLDHPTTADYYPFSINNDTYYLHVVSVGNPHGVMIVDTVKQPSLSQLGEQLSQHAKFPEGANISFVEINSKERVTLRVYERGAGETLACGSAAMATMACLRLFHKSAPRVTLSLPGGDLTVNWQGLNHPMTMIGPANFVFEGTMTL